MNADATPPLRRLTVSVAEPLPRTLLALTFVTGIVDAASFLALGQVFVAMQTGNVIFLGLGLADTSDAPVLVPLLAIAVFLAGGAAAGLLGRAVAASNQRALTVAIAIEVLLLGLAALLAAALTVSPDSVEAYALIALLALAMGLRNSVVRRLGNPNLTSTVLTLTVVGLTAHSPFAEGGDLAQRGAAFLAIVLGALTGALLLKTSLALAIAAAAAVTLAAGLAYVVPHARAGPSPHRG